MGIGVLLAAGVVATQPAVNQAQGQGRGQGLQLRPTAVREAVAFARSLPASELPAPAKPEIGPDQDRPRVRIIPNREVPRAGQPLDDDVAVQLTQPEPNMPAPILGFDGMNNTDNFNTFGFRLSPPDTNGDVGPNHYVQQVNLLVRVFNKAGAPLTAPFKLSTLFTPLGGLCSVNDNGDPVVLYDPLADRWILSQFGFTSISSPPYHECVAISQTGNPAGAYYLYDFIAGGNNFPDYPKLGVWPDAYYMTDVHFLFGGSYNGSGAYAFDRAKMLVGDPTASVIYFDLNLTDFPEGIGPLLPSDLDGVSTPPAGAPNVMSYMTANEFGDPADALRLFNLHADFANPANSTFSERAESPVPVAAFNPITPPGRQDIPQPPPATASNNLDAIGDRVLHRLQYRNRGGFESLVVNHTVDADSGPSYRAGVRYYELRNNAPGGAFSVAEQATFSPDSTNRWMGSAALDHQGNLAVGYSVSSTAVFPGIRYAGRLVSDPAGGLFQGEATLINGSGVQLSTSSRWGDYSALMLDPVDDCTFWYTTEYYTAASQLTSVVGWLTRVGSFKFPSCTARSLGTLVVNVTICGPETPVAGAEIRLNSVLFGVTGSGGSYSQKVDPGSYAVSVSKPGVGNGSGNGNVVAGGTTTVNVCLSPPTDVDLTVASLQAPGKSGAGNTVNVKYTINNSGAGGADPTVTRVYLSTNKTLDGGDVELAADNTPAVPGGGSVADNVNVTIPGNTTAGLYFLIAEADSNNTESETDETNNTRAKKIKIGPDLIVSALSVSPSSVPAGGSVTIKETTKNQGGGSTLVGSTTRYYLSVDKQPDAGDTILGTHSVPVLAKGGTHASTINATIPGSKTPGAYFVIAVADDGHTVAETNETNNKKVVSLTIN